MTDAQLLTRRTAFCYAQHAREPQRRSLPYGTGIHVRPVSDHRFDRTETFRHFVMTRPRRRI